MKKKSCGIVLYVIEEGIRHYLVIQHVAGHWGIPKGTQEVGEEDLETARREIKEEVGITEYVLDEDYCFRQRYQFERDGVAIDKEVVFFLAEVSNTFVNIQEEELIAFDWLSLENLYERIQHEETIRLIKDVELRLSASSL